MISFRAWASQHGGCVFDVQNAVFDVENAVFDVENIVFDVENIVSKKIF